MKFKLNEDLRIGGKVIRKGSVVAVIKKGATDINFQDLEDTIKSMYNIDLTFTATNGQLNENTGKTSFECTVRFNNKSNFTGSPWNKLIKDIDVQLKDSTLTMDSDGSVSMEVVLTIQLVKNRSVTIPLVDAFYNQGMWTFIPTQRIQL